MGLNYDELNPGIRETVRMVRYLGFTTTDSGDGSTNPATGMEGAWDIPHVHCVLEPYMLENPASHAVMFMDLLRKRGLEITIGMIQLTYDPALPQATTLSLIGVDDAMLGEARVPAHVAVP